MTRTVVVDGVSLTCAAVTAVTAVARREAAVAVGERADSALERTAADRPLNSDLSAAEAALPGIAGSCPGQEQAGERWLAGRSRR